MNEHCIDEHCINETVYEMLKPKFYKNFGYHKYFDELTKDEIIEMVALAYRSGYGRGKKDRPFIIREVKKHHEYVVFINQELHKKYPQWYPEIGTIGKIVECGIDSYCVDWGIEESCWWISTQDIVFVTKKLASELKVGDEVVVTDTILNKSKATMIGRVIDTNWAGMVALSNDIAYKNNQKVWVVDNED